MAKKLNQFLNMSCNSAHETDVICEFGHYYVYTSSSFLLSKPPASIREPHRGHHRSVDCRTPITVTGRDVSLCVWCVCVCPLETVGGCNIDWEESDTVICRYFDG